LIKSEVPLLPIALLLCVQSEMLQESNILKFKFQVQSSQVFSKAKQ